MQYKMSILVVLNKKNNVKNNYILLDLYISHRNRIYVLLTIYF
jgi:hypothetical protein